MPKKTNLRGVMICLTLTLMINTQTKAGDLGLENIDVTAPVSKYSNSYSGSATKTNTKLIDLADGGLYREKRKEAPIKNASRDSIEF